MTPPQTLGALVSIALLEGHIHHARPAIAPPLAGLEHLIVSHRPGSACRRIADPVVRLPIRLIRFLISRVDARDDARGNAPLPHAFALILGLEMTH